ncbi:MAG: NAD(P)/FAD-dependent oxidoreductase [Prevotella sp.]|nr:NAD(P)/FAD-dependent oxidoreductase [Prevotella sp.]
MIQDLQLRILPEEAPYSQTMRRIIGGALSLPPEDIHDYKIIKRSVDARKSPIVLNVTIRVATGEDLEVRPLINPISFTKVDKDAQQVVIVGAGPAGLFAALRALEFGMRPIVIERGKDVDSRRLDLTRLNRTQVVDPDSNYCFGEGGAGAFSDGKLFTRSKKRGNVDDVLQLLHQHGASEDILIDSHAHIGSDRLPQIVKAIRQTILDNGGEVHFNTRMSELLIEDSKAVGIATDDGRRLMGPVVLATGHSARDIYRMLNEQKVSLEAKGFAIGVRLEHSQRTIDKIQYHNPQGRGAYLPAAEYNFVTQADGRGVYSFCMCPGGVIVPAVSGPVQLVVNGMSASARAGRWANSGMVVEIRPGDFPEYIKYGDLQLLHLQEDLERKFYIEAKETLSAPAQRMKDFTEGKDSKTLPATSYVPGIHPARLDKLLPPFIAHRMQKGFKDFGRKAKGFLTNEATLIGLESRTSSPVRIPRDKETLCHPQIADLYPCGEGAGFAGGIVSAAIDGRRCVDALYHSLLHTHN